MKKFRLVSILFSLCIVLLFAHGGRTDKYGGHNNRKTGGYHYHNVGSLHHPSNPYQNHKTCGICNAKQGTSSSSTSSKQSKFISADKADNFVGEIKTVCGTVVSAFYYYRSNGKPTFLNIDKAYPNNEFMIVIWGDDRYRFNPVPDKKYLKKNICVTGKIIMYQGTAEIVVNNPNQIEIINNEYEN